MYDMCYANVLHLRPEENFMENALKCYTVLFNGVIDALDALERQDYGTAKILLIRAQQLAEIKYMEYKRDIDDDKNELVK